MTPPPEPEVVPEVELVGTTISFASLIESEERAPFPVNVRLRIPVVEKFTVLAAVTPEASNDVKPVPNVPHVTEFTLTIVVLLDAETALVNAPENGTVTLFKPEPVELIIPPTEAKEIKFPPLVPSRLPVEAALKDAVVAESLVVKDVVAPFPVNDSMADPSVVKPTTKEPPAVKLVKPESV